MKRFYFVLGLFVLMMLPLPMMAQLTLYGGLMSSAEWKGYSKPYGIYTFPATSGTTFTALHTDYFNFEMQGGGVVVDTTCYVINYYSYGSKPSVNISGYSINSWKEVGSGKYASGHELIPTAITYDATSSTVYGCFRNADNSGYELGTIDLTTAKRTSTIVSLDKKYFVAMGTDKKGLLYGILNDGTLYRIDKTTGALTAVGATGVAPSESGYQSAAFNKPTNTLYWAATRSDGTSGLYTVDTSGGRATLVSEFPNKEQVAMMYIPAPLAEDGAPAAAEGLKLNFADGATQGVVSFSIPSKTFSGDALSGDVNYYVVADKDTVAQGKAAAGSAVNAKVSVSNGSHTFLVVLSNTVGSSPVAKATTWVGYDDPKPVSSLTLSIADNGHASLSWTAPGQGVHGGYLGNNLKYIVKRYPDGQTATTENTSFSEDLVKGKLDAYYYTVKALNGVHQSTAAKSNTVPFGNALTVPYDETFTDQGHATFFTVLDNNKDGNKWTYTSTYKAYVCYGNSDVASDDWLLTPAIHLEAGHTYIFSVDFHEYSKWYDEKMSVAYGTGVNPNGYKILTSDTTFSSKDNLNTTKSFKVSATGDYHFGVHAASDAGNMGIYVTRLNLQDTNAYVRPDTVATKEEPARIKSLTAKYDAGRVALSWPAVEEDVKGNVLPSDSVSYYVMRVSSTEPSGKVVAHVRGTSYTDTLDTAGEQVRCQYAVTAANGSVIGTDLAYSNFVISGKPWGYPFHESFTLGGFDHEGWDKSRSNGVLGWMNTDRYSEDDDDGSMEFYPVTVNKYAILSSGKVDFSTASSPYLTYQYYALPDSNVQIYVKAYDNRNDSITSQVVDYRALKGSSGWRMASVPLYGLVGSDYVFFDIYAVVGDKSTARIDNVNVYDAKDNDVSADFVMAPNRVKANTTHDAEVKVSNIGAGDASSMTVDLMLDDDIVATQDVEGIKAFGDTTLTFKFTPTVTVGDSVALKAVLHYGDETPDNNVSRTKKVRVDKKNFPAPVASGALTANGLELSWKAPEAVADTTITDSFEDYDHWATSDFGDYLTYNGDHTHTYMITGHTQIPHSGEAFAFEVFNPLYAGIDVESEKAFATLSDGGDQYLLSLSAAPDTLGGEAPNTDHWIISPKVRGGQEITIWAKSLYDKYSETFEILYSSTDTAITSFHPVAVKPSSQNIKALWLPYSAKLPEDARYFAVRHTSDNTYGLALDDFCYIPAQPELIGYNIYNGNKKIASVLPGQTAYTVTDPKGGYSVSAVYEEGESAAVKVPYTTTGNRVISIPANVSGVWYDLQGRKVCRPHRGVYIHNGKTVIVK